jgi:WD40 repeat protein
LLSSGIDANVPPKGSVRVSFFNLVLDYFILFSPIFQLWKIIDENQEFLIDFSDHQSAVNVARFSPDGKMIASASDRQIVVYAGLLFFFELVFL